MSQVQPKHISRRKALASLGTLMGGSVLALSGCGGGSSAPAPSPTPTPSPAPSPTPAPSPAPAPAPSPTPAPTPTPSSTWASGGTNAITVNVPPRDPFANTPANMCQITSPFTLGPCYFNPDNVRQDISDGETGVPVILGLKIVDRNCRPISAWEVEIWHANREGLYSGRNAGSSDARQFDPAFCTSSNTRALASRWFRGSQITDSNGIVYFKTCFPGWYPGRTTHIHLQLRNNNVQSLVSQLAFNDNLNREIYTAHPEYSRRGAKDTSNLNDGVFDANSIARHIFSHERNSDNSMLVWKTIQVTSV